MPRVKPEAVKGLPKKPLNNVDELRLKQTLPMTCTYHTRDHLNKLKLPQSIND